MEEDYFNSKEELFRAISKSSWVGAGQSHIGTAVSSVRATGGGGGGGACSSSGWTGNSIGVGSGGTLNQQTQALRSLLLPIELFNINHISHETMLMMLRNKISLSIISSGLLVGKAQLTGRQKKWLRENTTDLYCIDTQNEEIMFMSAADSALFVLSF